MAGNVGGIKSTPLFINQKPALMSNLGVADFKSELAKLGPQLQKGRAEAAKGQIDAFQKMFFEK